MKHHDRPGRIGPDSSILVPLLVLFVSSLNGPTVAESFHAGFGQFFRWGPGLVMWAEVIVLNLLIYFYFSPLFRVYLVCKGACEPTQALVEKAVRHLNRLKVWILGVSITVFVVGKAVMLALAGTAALQGRLAELPLLMGEAAIGGYFVGAMLTLQFERKLYDSRQAVMKLAKIEGVAYSSLFSKVMMILIAILLYMTLEAFTFAGSFYSNLGKMAPPLLSASGNPLSGPELIFHARKLVGVKDAVGVFLLKLLILGAFSAQMLWQLKRIIERPLSTIRDRLSSLNAPGQSGARTIDIVQKDEFAPVFAEINSMIERQQGQLEISRKRLEEIIELAADPVIAVGPDRKVRVFNPAAEAVFGRAREGALDHPIDDFLLAGGPDFAGAHEDGSSRLRWKDASGKPLLLESHVSQGEGDAWTTVILHDFSKQAEIETTLRSARTDAENASRMKSEFLANMSHELRTPLNAILGFTQLLGNDGNLTANQQERLRIITRSGEHLLSLINDILDISKIEAGKMELHESVFDLHEFIGDLRDMFAQRCRNKGLSLYVETLENLPRYVRGDLGKLRQVMINLIGNAVKFTDEGGIGLLAGQIGPVPVGDPGLAPTAGFAGRTAVRFAVRDTGRGIPEAELELVKQPFSQASTTDHAGGTGLGLAISGSFIAMMGGKLEIASVLGEGSEFSFVLPLAESVEAPLAIEGADLDIRVDPEARIRVLVVDDQDTNRLVLREMLERIGFLVDEARDGREAFEKALETGPSIVFMDIKMPVMDGYDAVSLFKKDERTALIRVFALTASAFSHDERRIEKAGFDGFLPKPFKQSSLHRLIKERGAVEARVVKAAMAGKPAMPAAGPRREEWEAIGPVSRAAVSDAALINDFASLASLAAAIRDTAPGLAAALAAAAAGYDEAAVEKIIATMNEEGGDGR